MTNMCAAPTTQKLLLRMLLHDDSGGVLAGQKGSEPGLHGTHKRQPPTAELADGGGRRAALERKYWRRLQPRPSEPLATPQPNTLLLLAMLPIIAIVAMLALVAILQIVALMAIVAINVMAAIMAMVVMLAMVSML